eukprot:8802058-Pyramimonas_sp.AAC.1
MVAGLRRLALEKDPEGLVGRAAYTLAHRSEDVILALPVLGRRIALGNDDADRLAKYASTLHPGAPTEVLEAL